MDASYLEALLGESTPVDQTRDVWVVAETTPDEVTPATLEALGAARGLADRLGAYVRVAVLGADGAGFAEMLIGHGADRVALAEDARLSPAAVEVHLAVLSAYFAAARPEILLLVGSATGNDLAARLAARLETGLISDCTALDLDETARTVIARRSVYRGLYEEERAIPHARPQIFTLRRGAFDTVSTDPARSGDIERMPVLLDEFDPRVENVGLALHDGPVDQHGNRFALPLYRARRVVALGRGLGGESSEGLELAGRLAAHLGAVLAGDHSAYELGWVDDAHVVGITGPAIAPELYVACGIRGDAQHLAGMSDSRFVVAIHPDPNAPIFKTADVGIVGAPVEVLRAILDQV